MNKDEKTGTGVGGTIGAIGSPFIATAITNGSAAATTSTLAGIGGSMAVGVGVIAASAIVATVICAGAGYYIGKSYSKNKKPIKNIIKKTWENINKRKQK